MTDYNKSTGSSGTMRIRDTGTSVEFWLYTSSGSTFNHDLPWGYTVNGNTNNDRQVDYSAGDGWKKLGTWTVSTDQTVVFRLFDTGTSGFGGPTTLSVSITRSRAPNAPSTPSLTGITSTSINVTFSDGADNGDSIDARQIAYNTGGTTTGATIVSSDGSTTVSGLNPGWTYYFWARTHNSKGWSPWSSVRSARTLKVPDAPDSVIASNPTQKTIIVSFTDNGNGGSAITGRQVGYSTNSLGPTTWVTYTGARTITGLMPGTRYYLWSRVQNSVGWSPYSSSVNIKTIAGARVCVGGVWKDAIPYVNDGGVWKLARPWGRVAGDWKETT